MNLRKITAWLLLMTMMFTILPSSMVFAEEGAKVLSIVSMTRDATEVVTGKERVVNGTDLPLDNNGDAGMYDSFDPSVDPADITFIRRKQDVIIKAESDAGQFYDVDGVVPEGTLKIAYKDVNGDYLKLDETNGFELIPGATEDEAWIEIHPDPTICGAQVTFYNLGKFWSEEENGIIWSDEENKIVEASIDTTKLTASEIATSDHTITAHLFNAIGDQFAGYISVLAKDSNGAEYSTDYPIVADGQYPSSSISTTTFRHIDGEFNDVSALPEVKDTFIASSDFESDEEYEMYEDINGEKLNSPYVSLRHPEVDKDELKVALQNADESVWTMSDVTIDEIVVSDKQVSSGIKSVKYYIDNIADVDDLEVEVPHSGAEVDITADLVHNDEAEEWVYDTPVVISEEGMTILTVVAEDNSGLLKTDRYYFFIDKVSPEAKFDLVGLADNVISLLSDADTVTNRQQAIDMEDSADVKVGNTTLVSNLRPVDEDGNDIIEANNARFQYRLIATKDGATAKDTDGDGIEDVPAGYSDVVVDKKGNNLGGWKVWAGDAETPVIDKEFDGMIQVRVQDRAGNWSMIVSKSQDGKETIITDNTNPLITVKEYALDEDGDVPAQKLDMVTQNATNILDVTEEALVSTPGTNINEVIDVIEGAKTPWISDTAVLEVNITDEDLVNEIRSSGLDDGLITVDVSFHDDNETKEIRIWNKDLVNVSAPITDTFTVTDEYLFGDNTDKNLTFYIEYAGTGVADVVVSVKDKADVNDDDEYTSIYKVQLKVDKINPYVTYTGYDITDAAKKDLLKPNTDNKDYEERNMPWGPNSQVLEVVVKDDDITSVQSGVANIKFNSDKALDLYNGRFEAVVSYAPGTNIIVPFADCEKLANAEYESNVGYKFYLVYEGTGVAKVEFFVDDKAIEPNVRDYPSVETATDVVPVSYDAMLRVDKINPEIKNVTLVQTDADVNDEEWTLFTFDETKVDYNTRKQMKVTFDIVDETSTKEQSGVNIQNEYLDTDLIDVRAKYVENDKTHLYDNETTAYTTNDANDVAVDPNIDYILLPEEAGEINGTGGEFTEAASASNEDIEALVAKYLDKEYNADGDKCEWKKVAWKDGGIVIPDEFQGAIVLRTIDRVGNIDYSEPITFVAESKAPMIDFLQQEGFIYSQNNYGWSKRPYDYVEIRIKDDNEGNVDAWLENVFINVEDVNGNDISTKDTVKFAHKIHKNDKTVETDPTGYTYVSLSEFTNQAAYGYDVIDDDGLVETLKRDKSGYIHLGYMRLAESAKINITVFDKAKHNDADYTGNKLTATWTTRIDRKAPVIDVFELEKCDADSYALLLRASDDESGLAPMWGDEDFSDVYNKYHKVGDSFLYKWNDESDGNSDIYDNYTDEKGIINPDQYELPGLQYALLEEGDTIEDIEAWEFETNPENQFSADGYYHNEYEKTKVWHNYTSAVTPVVTNDFNGYIVVRAIDRAGNITVMGYAPTLDVTADDDWKNDTQYVNVKALDINGDNVNKVEYYGNNGLLYPETAKRDITTEALSGEGAFIEVVEEGITKVIVKASKDYSEEKNITLGESGLRNDIWEGNLILGNATATGYEDWKYQITDVKIDKTAPEFDFIIVDEDGNIVKDNATKGTLNLKLTKLADPIPNQGNDAMSHIASEIKTVEWCAVPEGSSEEKWQNASDPSNKELGVFDADAFTGTIKVRVTDNAGNVTEKSQRLSVDGVEALISVEAPYGWQKNAVSVDVTVSENAEFSDVKEVKYILTDKSSGKVEDESTLPLTGGTILVNRDGVTTITVIATTKAGVTKTVERTVKIDKVAPEFEIATPADDKPVQSDVAVTIKDQVEETSLIKTVEWCAIPEGSSEEKWQNADVDAWTTGIVGELIVYDDTKAFTGTIKVRVTDNAGNVTTKTQLVNIDKAEPLISISNDSTGKCSHDPVTVYVTVSENAEFSDVTSVKYTLTNNGITSEPEDMPLTGGTITVNSVGETIVKVIAKNKAEAYAEAESTVVIHYNDLALPTVKGTKASGNKETIVSNDWVINGSLEFVNNETIISNTSVWYSINGAEWKEYDSVDDTKNDKLKPGQNSVRVQTRSADCLCESDVVTYIVNYDNGEVKPNVSVLFDSDDQHNWKKDAVTVSISANDGGSVSAIKSINAKLEEKDLYFGPNGGNIVIQEEGEWTLENIIVTMESGIKYIVSTKQEGNRVEFDGVEVYDSSKTYSCRVAKIDRTAPVVDPAAFELVEAGNEAVELFGMEGYKGNMTLLLSSDTDLVKDTKDGVNGVSLVAKYEYAVVKNGSTVPVWKTFVPKKAVYQRDVNTGLDVLKNENELPLVVDEAFEGNVLVRVTDNAGNETIISKTVFTEGTKPEISVTAPSDWQRENFFVDVKVTDKGLSSTIKSVQYKLYEGSLTDDQAKEKILLDSTANNLTSIGGSIEINTEGHYKLAVIAEDNAGNIERVVTDVKLDKTAPQYSGLVEMVGVYNEHVITSDDWGAIHDGWTYNDDISLNDIADEVSGINRVHVKFTGKNGATTETILLATQTDANFSENGKYDLTLVDNAGNARSVSFTIDNTLENVINIVGIDSLGKITVAVTDGEDMLSFYSKDNSQSKYTKMYNGITDGLIDGRTGVRYIYAENDDRERTNTLYVIVAPSGNYDVSLASLTAAPNRYLNIATEGVNVSVKKVAEILRPEMKEDVAVGSMVELNEDGVYKITIKD